MSRKQTQQTRQSRMVPPTKIDVQMSTPEPDPSQCDHAEFKVADTVILKRSRAYPAFMNATTKTIRRYFVCQKCGKRWAQVSEIIERVVLSDTNSTHK